MNVRICATAASARHVQAFRGVLLWLFDAIATATISDTNAMNIRGARRATNIFGWSSSDAPMATSAKDGADSLNAVALRILRV
jgi:hypothetical protein